MDEKIVELKLQNIIDEMGKLTGRVERMEGQLMTSGKNQAVTDTELKNIFSLLQRIENSIQEYSERVDKRIENLEVRVKGLEERPANLWGSVTVGVIVAVASALVTWFIASK